ncbi:prephenate dehydrogenase [Candidatus Saccharibacteria bacterium]|nr:prephenate dehydrogenase [Candidatus Saccharibacteria bacterium]
MTISIIGYGQFGKLLTEILAPHLEKIYLVSSRQLSDLPKGCEQVDLKQAISVSKIIIPSVPMQSFKSVLQEIAPLLQPDTLIIDVGSVKLYPIEQMQLILPHNVSILATHPLFGPISVDGLGLAGQQIVLCPIRIKPNAYQEIKNFLGQVLKLSLIEMDPDKHDQEMAWIHGLSFFIGRGIVQMDQPTLKLNTGYFKQLTKLAEIEQTHSWELFKTVQNFNPYAYKIRQNFIDTIISINQQLMIDPNRPYS